MNPHCSTIATVDTKAVVEWLRNNSNGAVDMLISQFSDANAIWALGGTVFSCLRNKPLNDLDVAIDTEATRKDMDKMLEIRSKNYFGGSVYVYNGLPMDVWPLKESLEVASIGIEPTIDGLLTTFPFNLDKIAIDLKSGELRDLGCIDGLRSKCIEYSTPRTHTFHVDAARAFMLQQKTGFDFGPTTKEVINRTKLALRTNHELWYDIAQSLTPKHTDILKYLQMVLM